jgi:hypothetical protein
LEAKASVRKVKQAETTNDIFAFLTTEPDVDASREFGKDIAKLLG